MDNTRALEALQFVVVQTSEFQAKLAAALAAHVAGGELVPVVHAEDDVMPAATGKKVSREMENGAPEGCPPFEPRRVTSQGPSACSQVCGQRSGHLHDKILCLSVQISGIGRV